MSNFTYFLPFTFEALPHLYLYKSIPKCIRGIYLEDSCLIIVLDFSFITFISFFIKNHFQYNFLVDLVVADYAKRFSNRFNIIYLFRRFFANNSMHFLVHYKYINNLYNQIFLKFSSNELLIIPSLCHSFKASNWLERESADLFGVFFGNHFDLRRILTDYGFDGFPLRKDFPLTGYLEVRYDSCEQRVITEVVELAQDFRVFDFTNPWTLLSVL